VKRALAWASAYFKRIALLATVVGLALALWSQRGALEAFDWRLAPGTLALSIVLFALAPGLQATSFWLILRFLGVRSRFGEAVVLWMRSFLVRYAPTGALAVVLRVRHRDRIDATRALVLTATAYEQLVALVSGAVAAWIAFTVAPGRVPRPVLIAAVVAVAVAVALRPRFFGERVRALLARRGAEVPALLRGRTLAAVTALNVVGWIATGAGAWLLVRALAEDAPSPFWLLGAYAFAWLLGFVVPLLPGGLGLREGMLVAFLAAPFDAGVATALALALRLANTLGELVAIGAVEAAYRARRYAPSATQPRVR
jgi:glycosyltransferase 2 family protein